MAEKNCGSCSFWRNKHQWLSEDMTTKTSGECHRMPPTTDGHLSSFPKTDSGTWCGEYKTAKNGKGAEKNDA